MKLSVWRVGEWRPAKFESGGTLNLVVVFKGIDKENLGRTYKLNVGNLLHNKDDWLRACVEGNIVECNIRPGTNNVDKFGRFQVTSKVKKGKEAVDEFGQLPGQLELGV